MCSLSTGVGGDEHFDNKRGDRNPTAVVNHVQKVLKGQLELQLECQKKLAKCMLDKRKYKPSYEKPDEYLAKCLISTK